MLKLSVQYKERIDKYIGQNSELSRNDIKELIEQGAVYIGENIQVHKCNYIVREGQEITIVKLLDKEINIEPVNIPLDIKYEDDDLVIIDKPSGLVVHPSPGHYNDTLVNGLLYHFKNNLSNENGLLRPGIVHRIDKDTSGLLIIAKNNTMHNLLAQMLKQHQIERTYVAIAKGLIENPLTKINLPIARSVQDRKVMSVHKEGKEAVTFVHLLKHFYLNKEPMSLIKCELKTGRTHQIRVHMAYIKHPIYGDPTYGKSIDEFNQRLHAYKLKFIHPVSKKEICIYSPVPKEFNVADFDFNTLTKE